MTDTKDVARLVIRYYTGYGFRYLMAKRTRDGYWEFIGGKRKKDEGIREAAYREMEEELKGVGRESAEIIGTGDSYPVVHNNDYSLYPVLMELDADIAEDIDDQNLSDEHSEIEWIELEEFSSKETLGQEEALEKLDLLDNRRGQGDVVIGVGRREGKYLVVRRSENESFSGCWEFPGGMVESDEKASKALRRELEEETGLEVSGIQDRANSYIGEGSTGYWRLHPFLVDLESGSVDLSHEHDRFRWIDLEEIRDLKTYGHLKAVRRLGLL